LKSLHNLEFDLLALGGSGLNEYTKNILDSDRSFSLSFSFFMSSLPSLAP